MAQRRGGLGHSVCLGADRAQRRYDMSQPLALEGLGRMSRMTFLEGEIWLGAEPGRGLPRLVRAPEAGYPPYNIELLTGEDGSPSGLRITLAVAGFTREELDVSIEENQLVIRGRQCDDKSRVYLHRGIAARQFQRTFLLAEGMEVMGADLRNGLLSVDLIRPEPERVAKKIEITVRE